MLKGIVHYFSLERPVLGKGGTKREVILFTGVVAGTVAQWLVAAISSGTLAWQGLVVGFIASFVTYPAIFYNAGLDAPKLSFLRWCVAFQNGFFWPSLLEQVGRGFKP